MGNYIITVLTPLNEVNSSWLSADCCCRCVCVCVCVCVFWPWPAWLIGVLPLDIFCFGVVWPALPYFILVLCGHLGTLTYTKLTYPILDSAFQRPLSDGVARAVRVLFHERSMFFNVLRTAAARWGEAAQGD